SLQNLAFSMDKHISMPLSILIHNKNLQLSTNIQHRQDFEDVLKKGHEIVEYTKQEYMKTFETSGPTPIFYAAHNDYIIELTGVNGMLSKYHYSILPSLLQGMEESEIEIIEGICSSLQCLAQIAQEQHEQRQHSLKSFVLTSSNLNVNEELENYICSMNEDGGSVAMTKIDFDTFIPATDSGDTDDERLISIPNVNSRSKEIHDRLKEIKKDKNLLLIKTTTKNDEQQNRNKQYDDDIMYRRHKLRLLDLEEAVLIAQVMEKEQDE
ncbi:unnamed protein product, partial [Didymodactylos carnosus]